jgi:gliding motility-associated-like protein
MNISRFFTSKIILGLSLFFTSIASFSQNPVASFTTSLGSSSGGSLTICQGQQVTFINNSSALAGATYNWSFGTGSNPSTANTAGPHAVVFNSITASTTATLTVQNPGGTSSSASLTIVVNETPTSNITLLNSGAGFATTTSNGLTLFRNCTSSASTTFNFGVTAYLVGTTQTFNWGDGTPNSTQADLVSNQIAHNYALGQYNLTHTVVLPNGCQIVKQYAVFNGQAPVITVSGSGQNTCLPFPYDLDILSNNVPGTLYNVSFTDGSPASIFTTVNDTTISHIFNTSSCGQTYPVGPVTIDNAFQATIVAQNACGTTFATVGPITISTGTEAEFTYSPASPICQGEPVTFTNQSVGGENVDQDGCSNEYAYYWSLEEATGWSVTNGAMGSNNGFVGATFDYTQWDTPSSDSVEITFDTPGTYHMWLYTANACGIDSIMQIITINPTAQVIFNPEIQTICSGDFSDSIFMTSTIPGYLITWQFVDTVNVTGVTFQNGAQVNADTIVPFVITNPTADLGYLVISATVGCTNVPPALDTIYVNPFGDLQVTPLQDYICSNEVTDIHISSNLDEASFSWTASFPSTITGAADGTGDNIAQILFNSGTTIDTVLYTIFIGNVQCPDDSIVVPVAVQPGINLTLVNDTIVCSGGSINPVDVVSTPAGATFSWENTNTTIGLGASGSGQVPTWNVPSNTTGSSISGTITITATLDPSCPGSETDFIVTVEPTGNIDVSTLDTLLCSGEPADITVESSISSAIITWTQTSPSSISGANNGNGNLGAISDVLINDGSTSSIDTVFYTFSISNVQCPDPDVTISVSVQPQITMNDVPNILVCPGQSIDPDDFVTTPAGGTFTWTNDNTTIGIVASGSGQIATWSAPPNNTSTTITGIVTISAQLNGCPGVEDEFTVSINPIPDYNYSLNPTSGLSCVGTTADIIGTVVPTASTIVWSGPGIVSGQGTGSIVVNTPGNYTIVMTDPGTGCTATEVVPMEPPTQINISATQIQQITCGGANNGAITISTDNSATVSYTWTPNSGSGASINNLSPGTYAVTVTNEDLCTDDTSFVLTEPDPIVVSMIDSVGSECGEANGYLTVAATGGQGGFSYEWNNGNTGAINTGIDAGNHTVTVTDASGCSVDEVLDLGCTELIPIIVPQLITPNGDGKNDTWIIQNIQQYPEIKVWVYNRWGNLVYQSQPYQNDWNGYYTEGGNVDGPLPASTYFYLIDTMKKSQDPYKGYLEIQP